ncbi:hypothetical protein HY639_03965 [Candidatus Woesearchaeota archaeon]|nr:hypothetical protein [Candidatus Woesearchaeota archaeon]
MLCIDCCTLIQQSAPLRAGDVIFVSPRSLTYLSLAVTTSLETIPKGKHKVLVMDMLSTLLLYNDEKLILQFMHSLIGRLRQWDVQTLILTLAEDTSPKMLAQIGSFCDRTVRLS